MLVGLADEIAVEISEHGLPHFGIPQPPLLDVPDGQLFAEQVFAERWQVAAEAAIFGQGRAQRVDDKIRVLPGGLDQPDGPEETGRIEFKRVGRGTGHAPDHQIDGLQAVQGFQKDAAVLDTQIVALDQEEAEIARQIGVAEKIVVAGAGC